MYPPPLQGQGHTPWDSIFILCNVPYTDKKENKIFLIYKEIQSGAVAKSYMTDGEIFAHFLVY